MVYETAKMLAFSMPGNSEWLVILLIALLIFGRRLPEIARNMGKSMTEFKRGLRDTEDVSDDINHSIGEAKDHAINKAKEASGLNELDKEDPS